MDVEIRAVTLADADVWASLRHKLWPHAIVEELRVQVREFFDHGTALVAAALMAWNKHEPIGFIELSERPYVPGAASSPAPFIEGWYVEPRWRRHGVGRMLITAAEAWACHKGYRQLGSDALIDNTAGIAAHEALGFRTVETIRCLIKDLETAP